MGKYFKKKKSKKGSYSPTNFILCNSGDTLKNIYYYFNYFFKEEKEETKNSFFNFDITPLFML